LNDCFNKIRGVSCTLYIHKNFRNDTFEQALLISVEKLGEHYQLTEIQSSKFARVYKLTIRFNDREKAVYYKQYLCRSVLDFIKDFMRANRAERAFQAAEMLGENGFDVPAVIAIGKYKGSLFHTKSFLVTEEIEKAKQIYQIISDSKLGIQDKRELIRAFGQTIGKMHAKGIFHGDLRLGNILAKQDKDRWRFFFLDNERTRKFYHLPAQLRLKNLVQINMFQPATISNTDRVRFFKEYWTQNKESNIARTLLIKKVLKKTSRRLRKKDESRRISNSSVGETNFKTD
jgi:tRNA A-37 threonylcarbamoyl transferase component Bud32